MNFRIPISRSGRHRAPLLAIDNAADLGKAECVVARDDTDDGILAVTSRWCRRDAGEATTLLIRKDCLDDRPHELGYAIVQGFRC